MSEQLTKADIATLDWWTVRELANRWRCSADTVKRRIADKSIKAMPLGKSHRIHKSEIERHENSGTASLQPVRKRAAASKVPNLSGDVSQYAL